LSGRQMDEPARFATWRSSRFTLPVLFGFCRVLCIFARFSTGGGTFSHSEPNQVLVIHVFFCCGGSSGPLIHAYSWHNRSKSGFSVNCSISRVEGDRSENRRTGPGEHHRVPESEFKFPGPHRAIDGEH
jgi:hypothetical protein